MPSEPLIHRLSESAINKIAAGEVIERPANVVKELVENALDAGATRIAITLEEGGKELVRVVDNGRGMAAADARLAWHRHTTSKIREAEDIFAVASFGFRGEALSSIAAVAELEIETRGADEEAGLRLRIAGGAMEAEGLVARGPGTSVTVKRLFSHAPVRRKFLGSAKAEGLKIVNTITRIAFAHPGVVFKLSEGGKDLLHFSEGGLRHRAGEVFGFNVTNELLPVNWSDGRVHVEGFASTPQQARARGTHQFFYVNRRPVHSPLISRAFLQSYDALPPGRFPMGALFFTLPAGEVDVNVHPAKREVRFLNEGQIHWAVQQAVKRSLRAAVDAPALDLGAPGDPGGSPDQVGAVDPLPASGEPDRALAAPFRFDPSVPAFAAPAATAKQSELWATPSPAPDGARSGRLGAETEVAPAVGAVPYLQLHRSFIAFEVQAGMILVNQQAAHERILYERCLEELRRPGRFPSQQLLFPEVLEFTPVEGRFLEERLHHFRSLAFDLEAFGGNAFQLRGLPGEVRPERAKAVLQEMVTMLLAGERRGDRLGGPEGGEDGEFLQRLARAYARVGCVKLGEALDYPRIASLIDNLFATQNPYVSPSGAPIVVRYPIEDLRRKFGL